MVVKAKHDNLDDEIRAFIDSRDYWQRYLAQAILGGNDLSNEVIAEACEYLLQDIGLAAIPTDRHEITLEKTASSSDGFNTEVSWRGLSNVEGVNALAEKQNLRIDDQLTIIFGSNGAGKSGYVRLLKKAFYSKAEEEILPDLINEADSKDISADFAFSIDGEDRPRKFPDEAGENEFKQFAIFDGKCAAKHLSERNEFEFRPNALAFFQDLIEAVEAVESHLFRRVGQLDVANRVAGYLPIGSEVRLAVESVSSRTDLNDLRSNTTIRSGDADRYKALDIERAQLISRKANLENIERERKRDIALMDKLGKDLEVLGAALAQPKAEGLSEKLATLNAKLQESAKVGIDSFAEGDGTGLGTPEWKAFVRAAEQLGALSHTHAYPEAGDKCLLCNRPLEKLQADLIARYFEFVRNRAELEAKEIAEVLDRDRRNLENLDFDILGQDRSAAAYLTKAAPELLAELREHLEQAHTRAQEWIGAIDSHNLDFRPFVIDLTIFKKLQAESLTPVNRVASDEGRLRQVQTELAAIESRKTVTNHFSELETLVANLKWRGEANAISWAAIKRTITDKDKELSAKYFSDNYVTLFNDECAGLDGNFGIDIDTKGAKGRTNRQLLLKGHDPLAILSEGEQRVVAIADFLAESKMSDINRGIVFDDPVTSLDEERKTRIAQRLVKEATERQVVVFTHDLVFTYALITACSEHNAKFACHWIEKRGSEAGFIYLDNAPSYEKKYKNANVANEHLAAARKAEPAERERILMSGFAALRTSYESLVVFDLFSAVVERFNERVSVDSLKSVSFTNELRDELLDGFASCCRFMEGHSHSDRYAYQKPEVDNLRDEIERYNTIKKKIKEAKKVDSESSGEAKQ